MLFRILKTDILKRKGINFILFIFISIATLFLSSSVNNILVVSSAIDYYLDYARIPELQIITTSNIEKDRISEWLAKEKMQGFVQAWDSDTMLNLPEKAIQLEQNKDRKLLNTLGIALKLGTQTSKYNLVYDEAGNSFLLKPNEIALPMSLMKMNDAKVGDKIIIQLGEKKKEFRIAYQMKDASFGNELAGMFRMIVHVDDFNAFQTQGDTIGLFNITSDQITHIQESMERQNFVSIMTSATHDTFRLIYSFDMMIAGLCIALGICFILIALLVLRFTLVFTIEEQYQEIGILKAVGFRSFAMKRLYLLKYFVIVSFGAFLGFLITIPVSKLTIAMVSSSMLLKSTSLNIWVNLLCSCCVVVLVLLFCYVCTRKLDKVSAISAIRGGQSGERYHHHSGIMLSRRSHMPNALYLGINDILCNFKRYMLLMITFCLSFIIITIPINTLHTMRDEEMARKFAIDPESSVYLQKIENNENTSYKTFNELNKGLTRVEHELLEKGYKASLRATAISFFSFQEVGTERTHKLMALQLMENSHDFLTYSQGSAPELENEIAVSEAVCKKMGWGIGTYVTTSIGGKQRTMIITGTYSDYMQLGQSVRLNPRIDCKEEWLLGYKIMVDVNTQSSQMELANELNSVIPLYHWQSAQEIVDQSIGGIQEIVSQAVIPLTAVLCAIIMLIALLMEKLFLAREKGEIAMLKSSGFRNGVLRTWHLVRMSCVIVTSMLIAVPMSLFSNQFILKPIFAIMGAEMNIKVVAWQVYGVYPSILCTGILLATFIASRGIKRINIQELNNLE